MAFQSQNKIQTSNPCCEALGHLASVSDLTCSTWPLKNYAPDKSLFLFFEKTTKLLLTSFPPDTGSCSFYLEYFLLILVWFVSSFNSD